MKCKQCEIKQASIVLLENTIRQFTEEKTAMALNNIEFSKENKKLRNIKTSERFFNPGICTKCDNYRTAIASGSQVQSIVGSCVDCYGDKVYIVKNFKTSSNNKSDAGE